MNNISIYYQFSKSLSSVLFGKKKKGKKKFPSPKSMGSYGRITRVAPFSARNSRTDQDNRPYFAVLHWPFCEASVGLFEIVYICSIDGSAGFGDGRLGFPRPTGGVTFRRSNVKCTAVSQHFSDFFSPTCSPVIRLQLCRAKCIKITNGSRTGAPRREGRCVDARPTLHRFSARSGINNE